MQKDIKYYHRASYIKDLWKCRTFSWVLAALSTAYTIFGFLRDEFFTPEQQAKWGRIMKMLPHWPTSWWIAISLGAIAVWLFESSFRKCKEQKEEIEKLQGKMSFFEKNVNITIEGLEKGIKEIKGWFKYIKKHPRYACRELRHVICDKTLSTFIPTDKSIIDKSIGDCFPKILLFLKDYRPNLGNDIKMQYYNIQAQIDDIIHTCGEDLAITSEQEKLIARSYIGMLRLKNSIDKLATDLRDCVEIAKEERE